jgi:hypothetical protein
VSRVVRAWGRWRFATDAFIGHRAPTSAHQRALNRAYTGKRRTHEDYLTALRGGALRLGGEIVTFGPDVLQENTGEAVVDALRCGRLENVRVL